MKKVYLQHTKMLIAKHLCISMMYTIFSQELRIHSCMYRSIRYVVIVAVFARTAKVEGCTCRINYMPALFLGVVHSHNCCIVTIVTTRFYNLKRLRTRYSAMTRVPNGPEIQSDVERHLVGVHHSCTGCQ
jgi:hypothetical protein